MDPRIEQKREQLTELCRLHHVQRLALFGSALREDSLSEKSDLDFLVEFEPLPAGTYADTYFGLMEALEQLFQHPIDLVVESAIKNPYFRESVEHTKAPLYAA
jgi:predicted nucleotidyltransferase